MGTCKQSGAPSQSQGRMWMVESAAPTVVGSTVVVPTVVGPTVVALRLLRPPLLITDWPAVVGPPSSGPFTTRDWVWFVHVFLFLLRFMCPRIVRWYHLLKNLCLCFRFSRSACVLPLDLGMLYWCLELLVLRACASLCASFVVIPTRPSATPQELQEWRWLSDAATAAAVAAAEQVESSSFRQAAHVVRLAARAAAAATGTSGQGAVGQGQAPESQGASSVRERGRRGVGRASGGTRGGVGVPRGEGGCPRSSARPTLRWSLTLGD